MRLCIITDDKMIAKDDEAYSGLDISCIPTTIHALQWYETSGEIEYKSTGMYTKPANEHITALPNWVDTALTIWEEAKIAEAARIQAAIEQAAIEQAQNQLTAIGVQTL